MTTTGPGLTSRGLPKEDDTKTIAAHLMATLNAERLKRRVEVEEAQEAFKVNLQAQIEAAMRKCDEALANPEPFGACGRRVSQCDGSRKGCGLTA